MAKTKLVDWAKENSEPVQLTYYPLTGEWWAHAKAFSLTGKGATEQEAWTNLLASIPKPKRSRKKVTADVG